MLRDDVLYRLQRDVLRVGEHEGREGEQIDSERPRQPWDGPLQSLPHGEIEESDGQDVQDYLHEDVRTGWMEASDLGPGEDGVKGHRLVVHERPEVCEEGEEEDPAPPRSEEDRAEGERKDDPRQEGGEIVLREVVDIDEAEAENEGSGHRREDVVSALSTGKR